MKCPGFIGRSYVAQSPNADAEETINLFLDPVESGRGKEEFSFYRAPGLQLFLNVPGGGAIRGVLPLNQLSTGDAVWTICGNHANLIDSTPAVITTVTGIIDDGAPVPMVASPSTLVFCSGGTAYAINNTGLHTIGWFPVGTRIVSVGFINTYFLFLPSEGDGFFYSEPGDPLTGSSLNFVTAEASANRYTTMIIDRQEIWLFGSLVAQVFYDNSANDPNNPFVPNLSAVVPHGTVAPRSPIAIENRMCWLSQNATSVGVAYATSGGYIPRPISNKAVEYAWSRYTTMADAESWSLTIKGHPLWRISFPTANETWEYDFAVNDWRKVLDWDAPTGTYQIHRGRVACAAFGSILVGDRANGNIYKCSLDFHSNNGDILRSLRRAPILSNENKRVGFPWFELDMETGVGDGSNADPLLGPVSPEADPQITMRFSNDWAQTWSNERSRSMGKQGEYTKRVIWQRNGTARQRVFEITCSAAVKLAINGAYLREPSTRST